MVCKTWMPATSAGITSEICSACDARAQGARLLARPDWEHHTHEGGRLAEIGGRLGAPANVTTKSIRTSTFQEEVLMSFRTACAAGAALITLAPAALAQDWPNRSIVAVSTVSAGNAADTVARIVLDQVS